QPAAQVATHDAAAGFGNVVDALQRAAADEEPDEERAEPHRAQSEHERATHDEAEALRFAEVATDEKDKLIGKPQDHRDRAVLSHSTNIGLTRTFVCPFAVANIVERALCPAIGGKYARIEAFDIARKNAAIRVGDQIKIGAGL